MNVGVIVAVVLVLVAYLLTSIRVIPAHESAVIFRLGRVQPQTKGPGIFVIFVPIDRVVRVSRAEQKIEVPAQDVITGDELIRRVAAEVVFRVIDPIRALTGSVDYRHHILKLASVELLTACRQVDSDRIGEETVTIGAGVKKAMDDATSGLGVYVLQVNVIEA